MKSTKHQTLLKFTLIMAIVLITASFSTLYAQNPTLTASPGVLSFGEINLGESAILSYNLTGSNLISNVYLHTTMGYLISLDEENGYQQNLVIQPTDGEVSATIYVKFIPLFPREYDGRVRNRSMGTPDQIVALNGVGVTDNMNPPVLTVTPDSLDFGEVMIGDEAVLSYNLTGINLMSPVFINGCQGYLVSLSEDGDFQQQVVLEPVDGEVNQTIYVKFLPFFPREFFGRICNRTMGVMGVFVWLHGTAIIDGEFPPILAVSPDTLDFGEVIVGEEAILNYTLTGDNLLSNVRVRATRGYLVSLDEDGDFQPILEIEPIDGVVSQTIYVKFLPLYPRNYFGAIRNQTLGIFGTPVRVRGMGVVDDPRQDHEEVIARATGLKGNYPNPFNPDTKISFSLAEPGHVSLEVYNSKGQRVKTLVNDYLNTGDHSVVWNGRDEANRAVSSGIYFYRMQNGTFTSTRKMILMK